MKPDLNALLDLVLSQLARLERRAGRPAVRVSLAVPREMDAPAVSLALRRLLKRDEGDLLDVELLVRQVSRPVLVTVDFDLVDPDPKIHS